MNIGGLQRLSLCDYPDTPAAVIFLQGCNLRCPYCHNQTLLSYESDRTEFTVETVLQFLNKRRTMLAGVVISGGEPTMQHDLISFITAVKALGYKVKLDTNGTQPLHLQKIIDTGLIDYIAMDIKATWAKYDLLAGKTGQTNSVKRSIDLISRSTIAHHFRTTFFQPLLGKQDLTEIQTYLPATSRFIIQEYEPSALRQDELQKIPF